MFVAVAAVLPSPLAPDVSLRAISPSTALEALRSLAEAPSYSPPPPPADEQQPPPSATSLPAACVHPPSADLSRTALVAVVSVYKEWGTRLPLSPPQWLTKLMPVAHYQRLDSAATCFLPNHAFEAGVYLAFIAQHYHALPARIAFLQADYLQLNKYGPAAEFDFWQARCAGPAYFPLTKRRTAPWPPALMRRSPAWWARYHGERRTPAIVGRCWSKILSLIDACPPSGCDVGNVSFYPYANFLIDAALLRQRPRTAFRALTDQIVQRGVCSPGEPDGLEKITSAHGVEHLAGVIFAQRPLDAPPLMLPTGPSDCPSERI